MRGQAGKKYFYFKDLYEGKRITVSASELKNVEFDFFEHLEPRFQKKFQPRIDALAVNDAPEEIEKLRGDDFAFLDSFRDLRQPDVVSVVFSMDGLNDEKVKVRLIGTGDHCLIGCIETSPKQDFGVAKGDSIEFGIREIDDTHIELHAEFDELREVTEEDLQNGLFLKFCIGEFLKNIKDEAAAAILQSALRSSFVIVPCEVEFDDKAAAIMSRLEKDGRDIDSLEGEDAETLQNGMHFIPSVIESEGRRYLPAFTGDAEMDADKIGDVSFVHMPIPAAIEMSQKKENSFDGIVINPFTDSFVLDKDTFEAVLDAEPLTDAGDGLSGGSGSLNLESFANDKDLVLAITVDRIGVASYALYRNKVKSVRGIRITNVTDASIDGVTLRVTSDPEFFRPYEVQLSAIPDGRQTSIPDPNLRFDVKALSVLSDETNTLVSVELVKDGDVICGVRGSMRVLAYDQWMKHSIR